ncbi:Scr1 family TA system antitoxin-like transcriptional regulator [Nocardia sp. NPDC004068]|uniref:helix-turn-helix domain-containing protein n=1 Tax=Nocardia sp. NPDC004068 TaxID=3364303 RepID=UPI0036C908EB
MVAEGSTIARRALGRQLQKLRKKADMSQNRAAKVLGISPQTMARLEDGLSVPSTNDLYMNALCDHYGVSDEKRRAILAMAREARVSAKNGGGWWRPHIDRPANDFEPRAFLDHAARRLTAWHVILLPEIVQTPDYRRAVAWTTWPHLPTDELDNRIERVAERQRRLDDSTFTVEILLSEAAIREEWGGPSVMAEQRRFLVEIGHRPNVSIRVVPFRTRGHLGALVGSFSLLEFPLLPHTRFVERPIVHVEEYTGDLYLERSAEVDRYKAAISELRRVALSESDSSARILAISDEYEN